MHVVTVVGARPQFVKAAVVSRAFASAGKGIRERIVHTGQHFDDNMSDVFFREMGIPRPAVSLGIGGGPHGQMTGRMLEAIERVLLEDRPDWVLVYGDTNSTLAGALAAAKLHIPVAHVEAGLRSFNRRMPEEVNRVLTDHVSDLLLAPTAVAVANLENEGILGEKVANVGDGRLAAMPAGIKVIDPVGYLDMVMLESRAGLIATDSGGVQKEAFFCGVPCLTLRDETEWVELVECGANVLVGSDAARIASEGRARFGRSIRAGAPYGNGDAGFRIVRAIESC